MKRNTTIAGTNYTDTVKEKELQVNKSLYLTIHTFIKEHEIV